MSKDPIRIGFIPLVDCALLAVAQELGMFRRQDLDVELRKAQSWGQVQDKLNSGELDAAHCLITMPLQFAMGHETETPPLCYAFTLSRHGNGIILSNELWNADVRDARGLAEWMRHKPERQMRFGIVYPRGTQEYLLRSWLALGDLPVAERIHLTTIAPQEMVGRLRKGEIDGFCAGEPWSRRASASKLGRIVAESASLLPGLGEKILAVRTAWHRSHPAPHGRILRALSQASTWLEHPENRAQAVEIIASKKYVNTSKTVVESALAEALSGPHPAEETLGPNFESPVRQSVDPNFPVRSHLRWYLDQMTQWGHVQTRTAKDLNLSSICLEGFYASVTSFGPGGWKPLPSPSLLAH